MAPNYSAVGALIGDFDNSAFSTANIYTLSTLVGTSTYTLAAASARSLAASFADAVDKKAGDVSGSFSQKFDHYTKLAVQLEKQAAKQSLGATSVYAGGISKSDKTTYEDDSDRTEPFFTRARHDDPGTDYDVDNDGYT